MIFWVALFDRKGWHGYSEIANTLLSDEFGRCDRESKCSYFLNPYESGYSKKIWMEENNIYNNSKVYYQKPIIKKTKVLPPAETFYFDFDTFKQTLTGYDKNIFIQNLLKNIPYPFPINMIEEVVSKYRLGTVSDGYLSGAITFPYIDIQNRIRAIQVREYAPNGHGKRTNWLDTMIERSYKQNNKPLPEWLVNYRKNEKKVSCLFGEHLLESNPTAKIGLVEAPKTAILCSLYFKNFKPFENIIWLAVFNKSSYSLDRIQILKNRFVYVFPDLSKDGSTFEEWNTKAKEFESKLVGTKFILSDLLERFAPDIDKEKGNDIADFLIKMNWKDFVSKKSNELSIPIESTPVQKASLKHSNATLDMFSRMDENKDLKSLIDVLDLDIETATYRKLYKRKHEEKKRINAWNDEIQKLEAFFNNCVLPDESIKLQSGITISNCRKFIDGHLAIIKSNNGNKYFLPYLERIRGLKNILENQLIQSVKYG